MSGGLRIGASGAGWPETLYERVGGRAFFDRLVDRFYEEVERSDLLRPMYPEDLTGPKERLASFLAQYWGGPPEYSEARGHPRLRMRHARFPVDPAARAEWMAAMTTAVHESGATDDQQDELLAYFEMASTHLLNTPG